MKGYKVTKTQLQIFREILNKIHSRLPVQSFYPRINKIDKIKLLPTETIGYCSKLFTLKKIPGYFQIWFDYFANIDRITICITYYNSNVENINIITKKIRQVGNTLHITTNDLTKETKSSILLTSLQSRYFNKFIVEKYNRANYISFFLPHKVTSRITRNLIDEIIIAISNITALVMSSFKLTVSRIVKENKKKQIQHLRRERSTQLKEFAKIRDNYTCKICNFNNDRKYAPYGDASIEVHHISPLSTTNKIVKTKVIDLISVCANCHCMLHKMGATKASVNKLKHLVSNN